MAPEEGVDLKRLPLRAVWASIRELSLASLIWLIGGLATIVSSSVYVGHSFGSSSFADVARQRDSLATQMSRRANLGDGSPYGALISEGRRSGKNYVIPSIAMLVSLERATARAPLRARQRIVYSTFYLKAPARGARAFDEVFHTSSALRVDMLPGTDSAIATENHQASKAWDLYLDVAAGETATIVTGAVDEYPIELRGGRDEHFFSGLTATQEAFCYPNTANDVIGDLTILVESETLQLRTGAGDNAGVVRNGNRVSVPTATRAGRAVGTRVVSARFTRLVPGDVACLRVDW